MAAERRQLQSHSPESITADDPLTSARGYLNLNRSDLLSPRCGMLICIWKVLHLLALKEREATRCDVNPRGTSKQLLSETSLGLSKLSVKQEEGKLNKHKDRLHTYLQFCSQSGPRTRPSPWPTPSSCHTSGSAMKIPAEDTLDDILCIYTRGLREFHCVCSLNSAQHL